MKNEELHAELDRYDLSNWQVATIIHAMIDAGQVDVIECQRLDCLLIERVFTRDRGDRSAGLSVDHIIPQHQGGAHRITNLRLVHRACNCGWRLGITGSFHTEETKEVLRQRAIQQHAEGRGPDYTDPVRNAKISAAMKGSTESAKRGWETRRARQAVN